MESLWLIEFVEFIGLTELDTYLPCSMYFKIYSREIAYDDSNIIKLRDYTLRNQNMCEKEWRKNL